VGLADARTDAMKLREAALGGDPARDKQDARRAETFKDLAELYIEKHAKPMKRTWKEDQRKIERNLRVVKRQGDWASRLADQADVTPALRGLAIAEPLEGGDALPTGR
jgi:hypothetical protein